VRQLAQRTTEAAQEIKTLIQDAGQKVNDGAARVHQSDQTLEEIVAAVKRVTDIITEIAAASVEQAKGVEQVNHVVTQMDQMTQANTTQTETLAATGRALATQVAELQALVGQFKLHDRAMEPMGLTGAPHSHVYEEGVIAVSAEVPVAS
jgi:methyl-accepting chemotaxis protein